MHRGFAALLTLVVLGLGPAARANPFSATLGISLEGAISPLRLQLPGEATAGAAGSLQVDAAVPYFRTVSLYGPSFVIGGGFLGGKNAGGFVGTLAPSKGPGGGFGGSVPLRGFFTTGWVPPNLYDPVCFGVWAIGRSKGQFTCGTAGTLVSVTGWTTGHLTLTGMGGATLRAHGSDARTPGGRGNLLLVTPIRISGGLHPSPLAGFGTLSLALVPEPGTLALTATGALGLAALGRQRARRRRA